MIGFVIPTYKASEDLKRCKECIARQNVTTFMFDNKIFVHDNSIDNIYFTAAVNKGLRHFLGEADFICVINQDCFLEKDAVKKMVDLMQSNPDIGIVCACMLPSEDTNICIDTGGLWALPSGGSLTMARQELKDAPLLWATAACWLLRPEMIEEIGLLDENLVHFSSDVDYCYTARSRGWEVWRSTAIGIHRPKSLQLSDEMHLRKSKDTEYFLKKWCGGVFNDLNFTWQRDPQEQEIIVFKRGKKINVVS